jgi:hypothetical protein
MAEPLDRHTWLRVIATLDNARRRGLDPGEALHRAGLLLTPTKETSLKGEGMEFIHRQIVSWRPAEFLRRKFSPSHQASPTDMYACVVEFIEENIQALKEGK